MSVPAMAFVPLHTRVISLRLCWSGPHEVMAEGRLLDLRKRSIVSLGSKLRGPGVVHDMRTRIWVDTDSLSIVRIDPEMNMFPYVESAQTGGESCSGRIGDVQAVVGTSLSDSYAEELGSLIGGARGCFHIFTLLRLTGPALMAALGDAGLCARMTAQPAPAEGETLWARTVSVDSFKGEGLTLGLHGTLTDSFQEGGASQSSSEVERLLDGLEVMVDFETGFPDMRLAAVGGRQRRLLPGAGNSEPWGNVHNIEQLRGVGVRKGFSATVQEMLGDARGQRPVSHLVLMMAPVVMQSLPGLLEEMETRPASMSPGASLGTAVNSCHMWRSEGPLDRLTAALRENVGKVGG